MQNARSLDLWWHKNDLQHARSDSVDTGFSRACFFVAASSSFRSALRFPKLAHSPVCLTRIKQYPLLRKTASFTIDSAMGKHLGQAFDRHMKLVFSPLQL